MKTILRAAIAASLVALSACTTQTPGPSGALASVLDFAAYPGATKVNEWTYNVGGPIPMPGSNGGREYRTDDAPSAIHAYYVKLAADKGWSFNPPTKPEGLGTYTNSVGQLTSKNYSVNVMVNNASTGQFAGGYYGPGPMPMPAMTTPPPGFMPSPEVSGSPGVAPTPMPTPTVPPGPWYVRTDAYVAQ
jgi:hypothetical protein